jgi:hypothetical protein
MVQVKHTRRTGAKLTYDITANEYGQWEVRLGDKVMRRGNEPLVTLGFLKPGPEREREAVDAARGTIELLMGMSER